MNKQKLRDLFGEMKSDLRDFYDARRDMMEAERHIIDRTLDIAAEMLESDVIGKGDGGVTVVSPPNVDKLPHVFVEGRCVAHQNCPIIAPINEGEFQDSVPTKVEIPEPK